MNTGGSSGDTFDSAHSLASGVFNAAGIQIKATCGSSFITDVIHVERNGVPNAVKILTPAAATDPDLVARFLTNARYNQSLNEFTGMRISEIVDQGPRPYYVMERVAESSLLEVIRLHAPIDPVWCATLLLPVARTLDTIHQRNTLHGNIKPSNILVTVNNNEENFVLVDYLDPSLTATSATLTGAGIYAAPEFRAGMPVSNRSDIYSLAAVLYESLAAIAPAGAYRGHDGNFHVWRNGDLPRPLELVNPEIPHALSELVMSSLSPQAIARPASASQLIEESLRILEQPKARVSVADAPMAKKAKAVKRVAEGNPEPKAKQDGAPVPMLLIAVGVFVSILVLFGVYKVVSGVFGGSDSPSVTTTTSKTSNTTDGGLTSFTDKETALLAKLPVDQQSCIPNRSTGKSQRWPIATAVLDCTTPGITALKYGKFASTSDVDATYQNQATAFVKDLDKVGASIVATIPGQNPCAASPNESGEWGPRAGQANRGRYTCISQPEPRIIWTDRDAHIMGDASLKGGTMADLVNWWINKSGPK